MKVKLLGKFREMRNAKWKIHWKRSTLLVHFEWKFSMCDPLNWGGFNDEFSSHITLGLKADCTLKMKDEDCFKMMVGQLNPQSVRFLFVLCGQKISLMRQTCWRFHRRYELKALRGYCSLLVPRCSFLVARSEISSTRGEYRSSRQMRFLDSLKVAAFGPVERSTINCWFHITKFVISRLLKVLKPTFSSTKPWFY